jgi:hypothetical protein
MSFAFDQEFVFQQDFSESVVADATAELKAAIQESVTGLKDFLALYPGIREMSRLLEHGSVRYRITLQQ